MPDIVVYNTRGRKNEVFRPISDSHVRMYSCGPTVYARAHLGNLRPYMFADLLKRVMLAAGYRVTHVINITDVGHLTDDADAGEDKVEMAARRSGRTALDITEEYTRLWKRDVSLLNCLEPTVLCKATEHIPEMIELGLALAQRGYTYRIDDGIYFDVSKFDRYADFAGLDLAAQMHGDRIEVVAGKRNAADFAIWKFTPKGVRRQQEWDSPWGRGFPGWHLECSAMATKYLGKQFDVHTGGEDHIPVHHTNEIAQSEGALGVHPWVRYWMHNAFYQIGGDKISKSKGGGLYLDDLMAEGVEPLAYRYVFLQAVYRQPQQLTIEAIKAAATGYRRLLRLAAQVREETSPGDPERQAPYLERFHSAIRDDLTAPRAMAVVWEVARSKDLPAADRRDLLIEFDRTLGLDLDRAVPPDDESGSDARIDALVAERQRAREAKDFTTADRIRNELSAGGIAVIDTPEGPRWRHE